MNLEELEKIKKMLPRGYSRQLAKEFGVSAATVINTMDGKTKRFDIIKRAITIAKKNVAISEDALLLASKISDETPNKQEDEIKVEDNE